MASSKKIEIKVLKYVDIHTERHEVNSKAKFGTITITTKDAETKEPIKSAEYIIMSRDTGEIIDTVVTKDGKAKSNKLLFGIKYKVKQNKVMDPYILNDEEINVTIKKDNHHVIVSNHVPVIEEPDPVMEDVNIVSTQETKQSEQIVQIPVPIVMQNPELPNGCEITSLTCVVNFHGFQISKTEMADQYLPMVPFVRKDGKLFGANPYKAYAGNPREKTGFFSYAPPIVEAGNKYFTDKGSKLRAKDISGSSREQIISYLDKGIPVIIWVTLDLSAPNIRFSWYFHDSGEYFKAPVNLHCVVLNGYSGNNVHVMNPLQGQITYPADAFFQSYAALGMHALIIE